MPKNKTNKKVTPVRTHPRHVAISRKNPTGITIVDWHLRRVPGSTLTASELKEIAKLYHRAGLIYPGSHDLKCRDGNKYNELTAIWVDYFNKKYPVSPPLMPLDPDVVKALIGSESDFKTDPSNPKAIGIAQITRDTLKYLQDPEGEAKDFLFKDIRQQDLKDPDIAIPLATRWLFRKRETAASKLGREPTDEELILEYKGLLKSKTDYQKSALKKFRENYELLKNR